MVGSGRVLLGEPYRATSTNRDLVRPPALEQGSSAVNLALGCRGVVPRPMHPPPAPPRVPATATAAAPTAAAQGDGLLVLRDFAGNVLSVSRGGQRGQGWLGLRLAPFSGRVSNEQLEGSLCRLVPDPRLPAGAEGFRIHFPVLDLCVCARVCVCARGDDVGVGVCVLLGVVVLTLSSASVARL